jgi:DNA-binding CsgD family transcriptional regulator
MFDIRELPSAATDLPGLTQRDRHILRLVAGGWSPREIAERLQVSEESLYRLVAWVLEEVEPAPGGRTMHDVHAQHGSRPADAAGMDEFERHFGPSLPQDGEG